jgi:hypothetical protein
MIERHQGRTPYAGIARLRERGRRRSRDADAAMREAKPRIVERMDDFLLQCQFLDLLHDDSFLALGQGYECN